MPSTYSARLSLVLASLAACQGGSPLPHGKNDPNDIRSMAGAERLDGCLVAPDYAKQPEDMDIVVADCHWVVANGADCPAADTPLPWTDPLYSRTTPEAGCAALGRTVCLTAATGRVDTPVETGWTGDTTDTDAPPDTRDVCHYGCVVVLNGAVCGRPLRAEAGAACVAPVVARSGWSAPLAVEALPADLRQALGERWLRDAVGEHASIASFARLALDLLAHGAPADLIARVTEAQADEVRHATAAFSIASAALGTAVGPGALAIPQGPTPTLAQLAADTVRDGCLNESIAAAEAMVRLAGASPGPIADALRQVVEDEARHAVLARDLVAWAIEQGGEEVAVAVAAAWRVGVESVAHVADERVAPEVGLCGADALRLAHTQVRQTLWAPEVAAA